MIRGSCYCGSVGYEIHGKIRLFANCHCPDCRKMTGSAFSSVLVVESNGFKVIEENNVVTYESSPGKKQCFCKVCGCQLYFRADHRPGFIFVRAGSLDDDPNTKPRYHFWTSVKAPWYEITDDIPQKPKGLSEK